MRKNIHWLLVGAAALLLAGLFALPAVAQGDFPVGVEVLVVVDAVTVVDPTTTTIDVHLYSDPTVVGTFPLDPLVTPPAVGAVILMTLDVDTTVVTTVVDVTGDVDQDGVADDADSCPLVPDLGVDEDADGVDDACDPDFLDGDLDGVVDSADNCPLVANPGQEDTDADGVGDACEGEGEVTSCLAEGHPVATAIAEAFDLNYHTVGAWACEGYGYGEIARALLIAAESGYDTLPQELLDRFAAGEGWGEIMKDFDISPSHFSLGRIISGRYEGPMTMEQYREQIQVQEQVQEQTQNRPGNSANAPGHANDNDCPGNSCNAPGHSGERPGNSANAPGQIKKGGG